VRERVPELATLKTLGFHDRTVLVLVMIEAVLLIGLGGAIGMGLAAMILPALAPKTMGLLPPQVPLQTWAMGVGLIVVIGIVVGLLPALRAKRLKIVDALAGR
jgi:putative ABC transport system permease protein